MWRRWCTRRAAFLRRQRSKRSCYAPNWAIFNQVLTLAGLYLYGPYGNEQTYKITRYRQFSTPFVYHWDSLTTGPLGIRAGEVYYCRKQPGCRQIGLSAG